MEDFFLEESDAEVLGSKVKAICQHKHFAVQKYPCFKDMINYQCKASPYFNIPNMCPFKIRFKLNKETEKFYLFDYDDMHNH